MSSPLAFPLWYRFGPYILVCQVHEPCNAGAVPEAIATSSFQPWALCHRCIPPAWTGAPSETHPHSSATCPLHLWISKTLSWCGFRLRRGMGHSVLVFLRAARLQNEIAPQKVWIRFWKIRGFEKGLAGGGWRLTGAIIQPNLFSRIVSSFF